MWWGFIVQRDCQFLEDRVEIDVSEHAPLNRTPDGNNIGDERLTGLGFQRLQATVYGSVYLSL